MMLKKPVRTNENDLSKDCALFRIFNLTVRSQMKDRTYIEKRVGNFVNDQDSDTFPNHAQFTYLRIFCL